MSENTQSRKFGLLTTIAMVVGIVIGSGIFFKTPEVVKATEGNIVLGALAFLISALSIIFGGLTISQYTRQDENVGGIVTYCETSWGRNMGFLAGWFQLIVYYPAITSVISWVGASYTMGFLGYDSLLTSGQINPYVWPLALGYLIFFFFLNILKTVQAGKFQSISMICKITALIVLGIIGFSFGNPNNVISSFNAYPRSSSGLLMALVAVAFAFDGWIIVPSIAHEIKDPKKNLTKALVLAPLMVTVIYLLYYFGVSSFVGAEAILNGIDPVGVLTSNLFGSIGVKVIYFFVTISILGTLNGLVLGYARVPYAIAYRNELPFSEKIAKVNKKLDMPINSAIISFIITFIYLVLHFLSVDGVIVYQIMTFAGLEVDNLPIVMNHFFLIAMYLGVLMNKVKTNGFVNRYLYPILAIIGASIVIYAGATKPAFNIYMIVSIAVIILGLLIRPKKYD